MNLNLLMGTWSAHLNPCEFLGDTKLVTVDKANVFIYLLSVLVPEYLTLSAYIGVHYFLQKGDFCRMFIGSFWHASSVNHALNLLRTHVSILNCASKRTHKNVKLCILSVFISPR